MILLPKLDLILAGVAGLAALNHSLVAWRGKLHRGDGYFALFCVCLIPYALLAAEQLSTTDPEIFVRIVHFHMFLAALGLSGFLWFCAEFSQWKPRGFLWALTGAMNGLPWIQVFTSQDLIYSEVLGISQIHLPWGEQIAYLEARNGWLLTLFEPLAICVLGFGFIAGIRQFRRGNRWHGFWLTGGVLGFAATVVNDLAVNSFGIQWIHLAEFGFIFLVIFFTVVLYQELWTSQDLKLQLNKAEQLLVRSQRLEAMGTLAGGLAHDFNNILGGIGGANYLVSEQLLKMKPSPQVSDARNYLAIVERSIGQATMLIRQLLNLGRTQDFKLQPIETARLIEESLQLCRGLIPAVVTVRFQPNREPAIMLAEPSMAKQVMVNLCLNACQAMTTMRPAPQSKGGTLTLRYGPKTMPLPGETLPGEFIVVEVEDTGIGIPPEALKRIFEPFFTTKGEAGNGLGLSTAFNIMKQHGGFLTATSEEGKGTCFQAGFPRHFQGG